VFASTATPSKGKLEDFFYLSKTIGYNLMTNQEFIDRFVVYEKTYGARFRVAKGWLSTFSKGRSSESGGRVTFTFKYVTKQAVSKKPKHGTLKLLNAQTMVWQYTCKDYSDYTVDTIHFGTGSKEHALQIHMSTGYKKHGYKNLQKFKKYVNPIMFIRSKQDVAKELPPYTTMLRFITENKATKANVRELYRDYDGNPNYASVYIKVGDEESAKYQDLLGLLEYSLNMDEDKVVIYSPYKTTVKMLQKNLSALGYKVCSIHGDLKAAQRNEAKAKFLDDHQIIIINDAGNQGLNLQVSAHVVFYHLPLLYGDYQQTAGRISRIGTMFNALYLHFLITQNTIDEDMLESVMGQGNLIYAINPKLIEPGALIEGISSVSLEAEKADTYIRTSIRNRRKQYE
jgi:hypothetical protein